MNETIWLLLAGDFVRPYHHRQAGEVVVAVDGGIRHAAALGWTPQWWLGDFDSSGDFAADVPRIAFPVAKDETDFELALAFVRTRWPQTRCLMVIGADGDEADHAFGNLWVLPRFALPTLLFGRAGTRLFASGPAAWRLHGEAGAKVSVFALSPLAGLCYSGLHWPADGLTLSPFVARAARNALCGDSATIRWQSGAGVVFVPPGVVAEWIG